MVIKGLKIVLFARPFTNSYGGIFSLWIAHTERLSATWSIIRSRRFFEESVTDSTGLSVAPTYLLSPNSSLSGSLGYTYVNQDDEISRLAIYSVSYATVSVSWESKSAYERNVTTREEGGLPFVTDQYDLSFEQALDLNQTLDYGFSYRKERDTLIDGTEKQDTTAAKLGYLHSFGTKAFPRDLRYP